MLSTISVAREDFEQAGSEEVGRALEDSDKLDDVRDGLRARDVPRAAKLADRVHRLTPVQA